MGCTENPGPLLGRSVGANPRLLTKSRRCKNPQKEKIFRCYAPQKTSKKLHSMLFWVRNCRVFQRIFQLHSGSFTGLRSSATFLRAQADPERDERHNRDFFYFCSEGRNPDRPNSTNIGKGKGLVRIMQIKTISLWLLVKPSILFNINR